MLRILNASILGISGRQSELIELALTYGFRGLDIDITDLRKRVQTQGLEPARRFLESAKLTVSSFEVPCPYSATPEAQAAEMAELEKNLEAGAAMGAQICLTNVLPASDELPYHENFEFHRKLLRQMADRAAKHGMKLGIGSLAAASHRANRAFQFIYQPDQLLMLMKSTGANNIGAVIDCWNWHVGGGTLELIRQLRAEEIAAVRLADVPVDADPTTITESQRLLPSEGGTFDCVALLSHLAEIEYAGPVAVYVGSAAVGGGSRDALVQKISHVLDALYQAAGLTKIGKRATAGAS